MPFSQDDLEAIAGQVVAYYAAMPDKRPLRPRVMDAWVAVIDRGPKLPLADRLRAALAVIDELAYSPLDDDTLWMDDETPLGQFISMVLAEAP